MVDPYYYKGTLSRNIALASPELVIRDSTTPFDLYGGAANTAGLALRKKKNFITNNILYYNENAKNEISFLPSLHSLTEMRAGLFYLDGTLTYWLTNNDVISTSLYYGLVNSGLKNISEGMMGTNIGYDWNLNMSAYSGLIEYSRLITKNFTAGIILASYLNSKPSESDFPSLPQGGTCYISAPDKIGLGLSACFVPDLQFGKLTTGLNIKNFNKQIINNYLLKTDEISVFKDYIDLFNIETIQKAQALDSFIISKIRDDVSGINTDIAASFEKETLQILCDIGLTMGISAKETGESKITDETTGTTLTITLPEYEKIKDGILTDIKLKSRYGLSIFDIGLGLEIKFGGYKLFTGTVTQALERTLNSFKITAGTSVKPIINLIFPLEISFENAIQTDKVASENNYYYSTFTGKIGVEYLLSKEIALRLGTIYENASQTQKISGVEGPAAGTENNPNTYNIILSFGGGYDLKSMRFDLTGWYNFGGLSPTPAITTNSISVFVIMLSSFISL